MPGHDLASILQNEYKLKDFHFVNRLDQETSGLMVIGLNTTTVPKLQEALTQGHKKYLAILRGTKLSGEGQWTWPITDKAEGRANPQGLSRERKEAISRWKVLGQNQYFTEIEVEIETGRQHQIRKHAALAKHPIVGDSRYNEPKYNTRIRELYNFPRMALHAWKLSFAYEGQELSFELERPSEFTTLI